MATFQITFDAAGSQTITASAAFSSATATMTINSQSVTGPIDDSAWQDVAINMALNRGTLEDTTSSLTDAVATSTSPASSSFTVTFDTSGSTGGGGGGWGGGGGFANNQQRAANLLFASGVFSRG